MTQFDDPLANRGAKWIFTVICDGNRGTVMSCNSTNKVLVPRPGRIRSDGHGRSVWADPLQSAELELVSTQMLKQMLSSRDSSERDAIAQVADTSAEGVLARDTGNGRFEIIEDDDLQAILDANKGLPNLDRPSDVTLEPLKDYADDEHLSLVSTQALRKVLGKDDVDEKTSAASNESVGFNPYDSH